MLKLNDLNPAERRAARRVAAPEWHPPMLATLSKERFSSADWIFEQKLDGERCLSFRRRDDVQILSRNQKSLNRSYPEIVDAVRRQPSKSFIVDGEIVAFLDGRTSFSRLQSRFGVIDPQRARLIGVEVIYCLFDLLYLDGYDLTALPLLTRKRLLKEHFEFRDPLRFMPHAETRGEKFFREACRGGWEGIIAKRADSAYQSRRSPDWLKFKCVNQQEFVIGGYTEPQRSRLHFGALLLGYHDADGKLRYAGKVGAGFNQESLAMLKKRLQPLERRSSPFADSVAERGAHWVQPRLVAQVAFTEWTRHGRLRHPSFLGLRRDKSAREVIREPAPA